MIGDGPVDERFDYSDAAARAAEVLEVQPRPAICACGVLPAECLLPHGDSSVALCWVCAHDYTEHGAKPGELAERCDCPDSDVLPADPLFGGTGPRTVAQLRARIAFYRPVVLRQRRRRA